MAVSPSGQTVYVTGYSYAGTLASGIRTNDHATAAYNAATGGRIWVQRYDGTGNGDDRATSMTVSPTGDKVFVTGYSSGTDWPPDTGMIAYDYATIAYNG